MSRRRFLNLVLRCNGSGLYTVNQLDASNLFYKSAAAARKKNDNGQGTSMMEEIPELEKLPAPRFIFEPFKSNHCNITKGVDLFAPFGEEGKILCADGVGQTAVYDTCSKSAQIMPTMNAPKGPLRFAIPLPRTRAHAISKAACDADSDIGTESFIFQRVKGDHSESLYIMDMAPRCPFPFEVLSFSFKGWRWRPLPPPPFLRDPVYEPRWDFSAVVDGNKIFLSPSTDQEKSMGTYCFDTVSQEWEEAVDWVLPFLGKAEYVPELKHWFGVSRCSPYHFCAISSLDPPEVKCIMSDLDPPKGWKLFDAHLVNLGSGRFCTVKFFEARDPSYDDTTVNVVAVFTGVQVCKDQDEELGLKLWKHKSRCVTDLDIKCVL